MTPLKLFIVERTDEVDYDEYDSLVVAAEDEKTAIATAKDFSFEAWGKVMTIGKADKRFKTAQVVHSSFQAG